MKQFGLIFLIGYCCLISQPKFINLYLNSHKFTVEIADTEEKRIKGLMFRRNIPEDFGMLFVFEDENVRSFWMKNVFVYLDMIFLNKEKQIVDIIVNVPPCESDPCPSYVSRFPAQYVLELKANRSKDLKLKPGDYVFFLLEQGDTQ